MPFIQFQFRRDPAATWATNNPLLASGEMGVETDTSLFKIGNGTSLWNLLPYGGLHGDTGDTGLGFTWKGNYTSSDTYNINDVVKIGSSSYIYTNNVSPSYPYDQMIGRLTTRPNALCSIDTTQAATQEIPLHQLYKSSSCSYGFSNG